MRKAMTFREKVMQKIREELRPLRRKMYRANRKARLVWKPVLDLTTRKEHKQRP